MKRYVKELANDIINNDKKNKLMQKQVKDKRKATIEAILEDCKNGFITDCEAVYNIARLNF